MNRDDVKIGDIYLLELTKEDEMIIPDFTKTSLSKFIVIVGFVENIKYEASYCVISTLAYQPLSEQFPILKKSYPKFSKERSYLDLSRLRVMTVDRIISTAKYIDTLSDTDKEIVLNHLTNSDFISLKDKRKYGIV